MPGGRLRRWQPADASTLVQAWADPLVAQWNAVPDDPTVETASRWIDGVDRRHDALLAVDLVIDIDEKGIVGEVGLSGFNATHQAALIGYWLLPAGRRQGYATLGVQAMTAWAFQTLGLTMLVARCHQQNLASQQVAARAGYTREAHDGSGHELWRSRAGR